MHARGCREIERACGAGLQSCNVFLSDSTGAFLYGFASAGATPCRLQVENNNTVEVLDSQNIVWSVNGVPTGPVAGSGVLATGQTLGMASAPPILPSIAIHADYRLVRLHDRWLS